MRKTKRARRTAKQVGALAESVKHGARSKVALSIDERIAAAGRGEREHIIYLGTLVERTLQGEFGAILKALTAGRISMELEVQKEGKRSSDYHMGRASMGNDLWHDFEQFVLDKDTCERPLPERESQEQYTAEGPEPNFHDNS